MATNFFFNNIGAHREQILVEDLIIEAIKIHGIDVYYIPRTIVTQNDAFNEVTQASFDAAYMIEMYPVNVDGFEGQGEFLSKFGIEVRDQMTFSVAERVFQEEVGRETGEQRPLEGSLIYFPLTDSVFQIKYVTKRPIFYQIGSLQMNNLVCELFEYSNETFNTGLDFIDNKYNALSIAYEDYALQDELGNVITAEANNTVITIEGFSLGTQVPGSDNDYYDENDDDLIDWTEFDPFSEGLRA